MIPVTKPYLPAKETYLKLLDEVWQRNWLTNNGPLVNELELELKEKLGLKHVLFVSNGTIAIQMALKALRLKGEIITTPFSYVATTSSIIWEGCKPVFADIDAHTFNIDVNKVEKAITKETKAVLATHVFGNPCDVVALEAICKKHKLKLIYDGAHAFGVKVNGKSIFEYGDIATCSFHSTKLFHTVEGGMVTTNESETLRLLSLHRNFGHNGPEKFDAVGINGKNSEFHAAMGLSILPDFDKIFTRREQLTAIYNDMLVNFKGSKQSIKGGVTYNYAYYPLLFESEQKVLATIAELNKNWIYPRRYFYPSLNTIDYLEEKTPCPISENIASRILCLPLYYDLTEKEVQMIARIILRAQQYA
jgi:dTDP-4-amino-4,6-dideoxygalactose transaminase